MTGSSAGRLLQTVVGSRGGVGDRPARVTGVEQLQSAAFEPLAADVLCDGYIARNRAGPGCTCLRHGTLRCDPVDGLPSDRGDVIEIGVIVQDGRAVILCCGGREKIHHAGGAVLTPNGHERLNLASPQCDLVDGGKLDELATKAEDALVLGGITSRVA
jgi:hypothetical protein